jgi:hypothetical protein
MGTQHHYLKLAEDCMLMAEDCRDPEIAASLRALAADYLDLAYDQRRFPVGQQQQQIQPEEPDPAGK